MEEQRRSGGEAVVGALLAGGVDTVFGIPGVQTYSLFDALGRAGDRIRLLTPRHEQTAGYMAFGYARATGRTGVFSVVPGPGVLNAGAAIATGYGASAPMLCVTSEVPSAYIGSGLGHLHELPDQLAMLRGMTKWAQRIDHPAQAAGIVAEALKRSATGRPRPVAVEIPWDVLDQRRQVAAAEATAVGELVGEPDPDAIDRAATLLAQARNPMIMVGGGAQHAAEAITALAERLQAPVVPFRSGRGIVSDEHPLGFTCASGFERWAQTDVVVGIGTRMELAWFRWPGRPAGQQLICVDVDPRQPTRLRADLAIVADARQATTALVAALEQRGGVAPSRTQEFAELKAGIAARIAELSPHPGFLAAIRSALGRDGVFVDEVCQAGFTSLFAYPVYAPRTFISGGHQGTLGFGFPTALGVKVARPDVPVVSITGDGGFAFALQELATAVQEQINLITVVFDNGAYGNVARDQERLFDGRVVASRLHNPDWELLAESFGVAFRRASTPQALASCLQWAFGLERPALVAVPVDRAAEDSPWPLLAPHRPYGAP